MVLSVVKKIKIKINFKLKIVFLLSVAQGARCRVDMSEGGGGEVLINSFIFQFGGGGRGFKQMFNLKKKKKQFVLGIFCKIIEFCRYNTVSIS
jgi:hypothetical protein